MLSTTDFDRTLLPPLPVSRQQLTRYLDSIWQEYFSDIPRLNRVDIAYCQPWKRRLGLIRLSLDGTKSFIGINALLQLQEVPDCVLYTTIAHELTHYAHGFGSPLPRIFEHPHANNIVQCELVRRGLGELASRCDDWIDKQWFSFYDMQREADWADIIHTSHSAHHHE